MIKVNSIYGAQIFNNTFNSINAYKKLYQKPSLEQITIDTTTQVVGSYINNNIELQNFKLTGNDIIDTFKGNYINLKI